MEYSPDLNPEDLENFMEFKFKISYKNWKFKLPYYGTQAKNASTIKRFLQIVFTTEPIKVKIKHYKLKRNNTAEILKNWITKTSLRLMRSFLSLDNMKMLLLYMLCIY